MACLNPTLSTEYSPHIELSDTWLTVCICLTWLLANCVCYQDDPVMRQAIPFLACGDLSGWDADQNYDLGVPSCSSDHAGAASSAAQYVSLDPVQPPTAPAYKTALQMARHGGAG